MLEVSYLSPGVFPLHLLPSRVNVLTAPPPTLLLSILEPPAALLLGVIAAFLFLSLPSVINLAIFSHKAQISCQAPPGFYFLFQWPVPV